MTGPANGNGRMSTILFNGLLIYLAALGGGMVVVQAQIASIAGSLPLSTDDRYRRRDAERDFGYVNAEITDLKNRVRNLETFHEVTR